MKLTELKAFLAIAIISLPLTNAEAKKPNKTASENAPRGNVDGYQDELKLYLLDRPLRQAKGVDIMEPSSMATAKSNMQELVDALGDKHLLETIVIAKRQTCAQLQASTCPEHFKALNCDALSIPDLRELLIKVDVQIGSAEGAPPGCVDALRKGLILFDLLIIFTPLNQFQSSPSEGPRNALTNLFRALSMGPPEGSQGATQRTTESSDISTEAFIQMHIFKKSKPKPNPHASEETAFHGTGGPLVSLFINWIYQAYVRFDEFFGGERGSRRPLAPLRALQTNGHEQRLTHLSRMCGTVLGSRRRNFKLPPNTLVVPRELFTRTSHLVGLPRVSCDMMTQAALSLHLAEVNAIEHINNLQGLLSSEEMEYSVPLELFAGGPTNYRRLCVSFRARKDVESLLDTPCSFEDTVLSSLEARSEGVTPQTAAAAFLESTSTSHDSLLEPTTAQQEPVQIASQNAELAFLLLSLRGGNYEAGARLLAADGGPWWTLLFLIDSRTSSNLISSYERASTLCKKALKKMGRHAANTSEQSITCSSTWNTEIWDKQLHCKSQAVALQCKALESLFGIFNKELLHVIQDFLNSVAKEAACGSDSVKCPKKLLSSQAPLTIVGKDPSLLSRFLQQSPSGDSLLRTFALISGNKWKDAKGLISGADGVDNIFQSLAQVVSQSKTSVLLSRWLPRSVKRLVKKFLGRKYTKQHFRFLSSKLSPDFYMKLRSNVDVLIHPLVFLHLNQMAFTRSEKSGARSRAGGLSERLDNLIAETATSGLPQKLKEKLTAGEKTTVKDFDGINFAHVEQPKPNTWQKYLKLELLDSMHKWLRQPETTERIKNECNGGKGSNIAALFRDSMDLLKSSEAENLTLIGKVVSPRETSVGKPWGFKSVLKKLLRLPAYKTQHHSFVAVNVKIPETLEMVRVLVNVYTQNKGIFTNQEVFFRAVTDLFEHYEQKNRLSSGRPLGVPESLLVPPLHRNYAALPKEDRLQALKDTAMANFFRHIWTLIFSVSAHNILNAGNLDSLEKTFSDEAWQLSINDPFQASSFGMVMMGGDMGLKLFNELLPTDQKRMLKKAKYGSPTVFTSQMQLTGSLLSASGHSGLGMFLHAQAVYFGVMIKKWIQKRKEDRIREIISWLTLGMFFASSFVQVTDGVMEITNTGNETGQASMTGSCPPMGLCVDSSGNTFIANPTGSPALTALQVVMKTGLMASMAMIAGPLVAVYNIAVSHIQILSRLEMALGNTFKQLVTRLSKSKTIKNIKKLFAKEEKLEKGKKEGAAKVSKSLGDEVEQSLTAFFQENFHFHERQERCQR